MGRYDFNYGYNIQQTDSPTYACLGAVVCMECGKHHGYCIDFTTGATERDGERNEGEHNMDLSKQVSGKKRNDFEKRDWIAPEDLPAKGSSKWKIDNARDAKKNKTGILLYVDLTRGKIKRVMSLRKNFTLDMFVEELGANSDKWPGKTIDLERGGSDGQYVNVAG